MFIRLAAISTRNEMQENKMSRRQEVTLYAYITAIAFAAVVLLGFTKGATCNEICNSSSQEWRTGKLGDTPAFGDLVWAKSDDGIQLRFHYTLPEDAQWLPLLAPDGTEDSRQAASLKMLFGGLK